MALVTTPLRRKPSLMEQSRLDRLGIRPKQLGPVGDSRGVAEKLHRALGITESSGKLRRSGRGGIGGCAAGATGVNSSRAKGTPSRREQLAL